MQKSRWRTIGHKLVINVKKKLSEKKLRAQEFHVNNFEFKPSNTIELRYYFLGRARTTQWQQHKVSFTLARSTTFWKNHSVANSIQKMSFRFPNCNNVFVQLFSSPIISFRTVKISLQTDDSFRKCFWSLNDIKNGGCRHPLATENLMYKTMQARKKNFKQQSEIDWAIYRSQIGIAKVWNHRSMKFKKWCLHP